VHSRSTDNHNKVLPVSVSNTIYSFLLLYACVRMKGYCYHMIMNIMNINVFKKSTIKNQPYINFD